MCDSTAVHTDIPCRALPEATLRRVAQAALLRVAEIPARDVSIPPSRAEIERLCAALLEPKNDSAQREIEALLAGGRSKTAVALGHLPDAARRLGEMWECDEVTFAQVGQAAGRLQRLLRLLRPAGTPRSTSPRSRALFATMPSETHTLGVILAADICRARGWSVALCLGETLDRLCAMLGDGAYSVLGVSVGSARSCAELVDRLPEIRAAAPGTAILMGGAFVATSPWQARSVAVDGWATDAAASLMELDRLANRHA